MVYNISVIKGKKERKMNNTVIVGRLTNEPTIEETGANKKFTTITLAVSRNYKNEQGEYEIDYIPCLLYSNCAENTCEYCHKGDVIGVKGRIESNKDNIYVVAERVTFLSSHKKEGE